jgi:flavin-dependent dehydrogenase
MIWDVAVAGGGLAGAAAAIDLARGGRRVVLFERASGPHHKVCGEFVSAGAQARLERLGGRALATMGAQPIERVRVVCGRQEAATPLPFPAWGLSRRRLDAWLLDVAEGEGVEVRRGCAVQALAADGSGVGLRTGEGEVSAGAALLATGKHDLRGHRRAGAASLHIGFKLHLRLAPGQHAALGRQVDLALFDGGYAGLQLIEDGIANLCLLVTKAKFARLGRDWASLIAAVPHLAHRLDGATACWPQPLAISRIPYGFRQRADAATAIFRIGDQAAVIPSFTGDGMAMALRSAAEAAQAILTRQPAVTFQRHLSRSFAGPLRVAGAVAGVTSIPALQPPLVAACRAFPGLLAAVAARTRAA